MMKRLHAFLQKTAVACSLRSDTLRKLLGAFYAAALAFLRFGTGPVDVRAVYLRQGLLEPGWIPGASDIDSLWILEKATGEKTSRLVRWLSRLKLFFPFLGEAPICDEAALVAYLQSGDAKRRTFPRWRLLRGKDSPSPLWRPSVPGELWALDSWSQALEAYELFLKNFFLPGEPGAPNRQWATRKHALDVFRWLRWAHQPDQNLEEREETARRLKISTTHGKNLFMKRLLGNFPGGLVSDGEWAGEAVGLVRCLEEAGVPLKKHGEAAGSPESVLSWPMTAEEDAWETQAWEKRFTELQAAGGRGVEGLFWNTLSHTTIIVSDELDDSALADLFIRIQRFKQIDRGLQGPLHVLTRRLFHLQTWTNQQGTPLRSLSIQRGPSHDRTRAWRYSTRSLLRNDTSGQAGDWSWLQFPSISLLDPLMTRAAAVWLLHWRGAAGTFHSSARVLSWKNFVVPPLCSRLWLEKRRAADPLDLEGLLRHYAESFPEDGSWMELLDASLDSLPEACGNEDFRKRFLERSAGWEKLAKRLLERLSPDGKPLVSPP